VRNLRQRVNQDQTTEVISESSLEFHCIEVDGGQTPAKKTLTDIRQIGLSGDSESSVSSSKASEAEHESSFGDRGDSFPNAIKSIV
jgi:hypothetical protein